MDAALAIGFLIIVVAWWLWTPHNGARHQDVGYHRFH